MNESHWAKLGDQLLALDQWEDFGPARTKVRRADPKSWIWDSIEPHPVNIIVNAGVPAEHFPTYVPALLQALDDMADGLGYVEMIVRALTKKGLVAAVPKLLALYQRDPPVQDSGCLWAVGNAIYTIEPRDHLAECLAICRNSRLGMSRERLIVHLSRFKKSDEVYRTLISLLGDETVRGAPFEALKRLGDIRAIGPIERTPVRDGDDGIYETHQKMMALKKLGEKRHQS